MKKRTVDRAKIGGSFPTIAIFPNDGRMTTAINATSVEVGTAAPEENGGPVKIAGPTADRKEEASNTEEAEKTVENRIE